ncbi:ribosomal protein S18-alanine N-acetyltransferase [Cyanobacterium stanieri LEGE 03274]|uniref:[Ribosomal protein bS18]-alanine N-acetyltransferase n=1 Tax=Cyanobacterium stanieri LEGE 03274 TaxID=1828756 RepID=A0ABR9V4L5_9CHRO|nr:ribosomal protein S18-alanine N-acetyltransferase [Cyanobacterium stanieri]MBE9222823.1 ribosomal protein S18-alanine N-acetyltransferase [Cyanobacterium stanieri LEGE 03274]
MSLTTIKLQPLTEKHLSEVIELDQICFGGLWSLEGYKREIESPNSTLLIITTDIKNEEKIIGLGCFWAIVEEAHVTILAIHPDFQRQGLGKMLLEKLLKQAKEKGLERATLEVSEHNQSAIALYEKFGFALAGRRKKYYQATGADALIFWKKLT